VVLRKPGGDGLQRGGTPEEDPGAGGWAGAAQAGDVQANTRRRGAATLAIRLAAARRAGAAATTGQGEGGGAR